MIIGHQQILDFLEKSIENKRLAHTYLFTGSAHLGKRTVALEFIRMLNGPEMDQAVHPDVLIVEPERIAKKGITKELEIGIGQARQIQHQMSLFPYQASYKIALIDQAEKMTAEASNCLLKTLEEPSGRAVLILITANPNLLLPTIVSRCQSVRFLPVGEREIEEGISNLRTVLSDKSLLHGRHSPQGQPLNHSKKIVRLANGRPGLAIQYLEEPTLLQTQDKIIGQLEGLIGADLNSAYQYVEQIAKDVPRARQILKNWLFWFRDLLLLKTDCPDLIIYPQAKQYRDCYSLSKLKDIIQAIRKTDYLLSNPGINHRLALEVLILEMVR